MRTPSRPPAALHNGRAPSAQDLLLGEEPIVKPGGLTFRRLRADDLFDLEPQASQRTWLGVETASLTIDQAQAHADGPNSWTAILTPTASLFEAGAEPRILACLGVLDVVPGQQGAVWALLGTGLGRHHLPLTRFLRDVVIGECPLARLDTFVPVAAPAASSGSQLELVSYALQHPTPELRWALMAGMLPLAVMRRFGADDETIMQLERVRPVSAAAAAPLEGQN